MAFGTFSFSRRIAQHYKQFQNLSSPVLMITRNTIFSNIHLYSSGYSKMTEVDHQPSSDLIKIMKRGLPAIERVLKNANVWNFMNQTAEYSREANKLCKLRKVMELIDELRDKEKEIEDSKSLIAECTELLKRENEEYYKTTESLLNELLKKKLLLKADVDDQDCDLEVTAGTGGKEASLYAIRIFEMYERYSMKNGWNFKVEKITNPSLKGRKKATAVISGTGVYGKLKFEGGIHKVQHGPSSTCAVSVIILPKADEVDVPLKEKDLIIKTYRPRGPGGQRANTTNSAVRITHKPSGIKVSNQDERCQKTNEANTRKKLKDKLLKRELSEIKKSRSLLRKKQIGNGERPEYIRTYNFPQGNVTDHRVEVTYKPISDVIQGEKLDVFINALHLQEQMDEIASFEFKLRKGH